MTSLYRTIFFLALFGAVGCSDDPDQITGDAETDTAIQDGFDVDAGGSDADVAESDVARDTGGPRDTDVGFEMDAAADTDVANDQDVEETDTADTDAASPQDVVDDAITLELIEGCNPFATSDECLLPYPSAFYQVPDDATTTGIRVQIPQEALPVEPGEATINLAPINTADGCSPAGPILLHFGVDIDAEQLTEQNELPESLQADHPIALFDAETGRRILFMSEMDANRRPGFDGRYGLIIRPMEPMEMGHRHVVVLTDSLRDADGNAFESPPAFAALRDDVRTTNSIVEDVRDQYEELFELLDNNGYARDELLLAWDFQVASEDYLTGSVRSMRAEALDEVAGTGMRYTIESIQESPNAIVAALIQGTFEVPTYLNAENVFVYDDQHHPIRQTTDLYFPFTMLIPQAAVELDVPLPLVVFGHGLFGTGRGTVTANGTLAASANEVGMVLVATDWIGLSGGDLDLIISDVIPDLNRIALLTDRLQQSIINHITLTELAIGQLSDDSELRVGSGPLIDDSRIYYAGGSLGGIQGTSFVAMSPRVTRGVLSVPGAGWLNMLTRSTNWNRLRPFINLFYPDPLLQQIGIALLQSLFDHSDPVNLSRHLFARPLEDAPTGRVVLLHEAIGDSQVPNLASEMLARSIGVRIATPSIYDVPGLDTIELPTTESVLVQIYEPDRVDSNPPPEGNVSPATDNGTHGSAPYLPNILQQAFGFLLDGVIVSVCDGACDPD
jgi:hypothetical protein